MTPASWWPVLLSKAAACPPFSGDTQKLPPSGRMAWEQANARVPAGSAERLLWGRLISVSSSARAALTGPQTGSLMNNRN